jgi:hypothetical protein
LSGDQIKFTRRVGEFAAGGFVAKRTKQHAPRRRLLTAWPSRSERRHT